MYLFSFLTITYNRPLLIDRLYNSILNCNIKKEYFDWIIIINGRSDNLDTITKVENWKVESKLNIRYFIIEKNQGLTRALNFYNTTPTTSYFVMRIDDDDILNSYIHPKIIELMEKFKKSENFGLILNMNDLNGKNIGSLLPNDEVPRTNYHFHFIYKVQGDKSRIYPTKVLKRFHYKIFENEFYTPDSLIYYRMDSVLKLIPLNFSPIIREYLPSGLTKNSIHLLKNNIESILFAYKDLINHPQARTRDKIMLFLNSIIIILKSKKYRMINKVTPISLSLLTLIFLFPIYKIYSLFKNFNFS